MSYKKELSVGTFILLGILCVSYLTIKLGRMDILDSNAYPVYASFSTVAGLKSGADVQIAGVSVGNVGEIILDPNLDRAKVKILLKNNIKLSDDTIASIKTSGIIGDKYLALSVGGSSDYIEANGEISETSPPMDLEALIGNFVFGAVK